MSETKFTPGPWSFVDKKGANLEIQAKVNIGRDAQNGVLQPIYDVPVKPFLNVCDDGSVVATLAFDDYRQFPSENFVAMQVSNGHLMAVAPELYAMCKEMICALEINHSGAVLLKEARALLKKARGES